MENLFPSRRGTVPRTAVFVKMVLPSLRLPHLPCTALRSTHRSRLESPFVPSLQPSHSVWGRKIYECASPFIRFASGQRSGLRGNVVVRHGRRDHLLATRSQYGCREHRSERQRLSFFKKSRCQTKMWAVWSPPFLSSPLHRPCLKE